MISHLCNALIYQSGLFAGFYSTINLGDASIATEDEDVLVLEDGSETKIITENGMVSGSIPGFYGYNKTFTPRANWDVTFEQTGEVKYLTSANRLSTKPIDCGGNDCPIAPVTNLKVKYIGPGNSTSVGFVNFAKNQNYDFQLWALTGGATDFKYHWILREDSYDYIAYITSEQYRTLYDSNQGLLTGDYPRYQGSQGPVYIYNDQLIYDENGTIEILGDFA